MTSEFSLLEFIELDNSLDNSKHALKKKKRNTIRQLSCAFDELDKIEFINRYRLNKEAVLNLCNELRPFMKEGKKSIDLTIENKVLIALSFFATGSYQTPTGDISAHSVAQQTVSDVIKEVSIALNTQEIRRKYIKFPKTIDDRNQIRRRFYENFGFPGVLGCIDCTHVAIIRPSTHEERYYCRKQYHSLNVQLICDADMQILSVDSSFGGANHDSFIWNVHPLKIYMENLNECSWFLGDSGYPLRRYMLTPIIDAAPGTPELHYTEMHVRTRNVVERTIGLLKARFRCLLVHRVLHYPPEKAALFVNACVVLHNICNKNRLPVPVLSHEEMLRETQMQLSLSNAEGVGEGLASHHSSDNDLQQGVATRRMTIARLWDDRTT